MQIKKTISIVAARQGLGRLAEEVRRTGQSVILTRRGRAVARLIPEPVPTENRRDAFAALRGTVQLHGGVDALGSAIRALRVEFAGNLDRRAQPLGGRRGRHRA